MRKILGTFMGQPSPKKGPEAVRLWEQHKPGSRATSGLLSDTSAQIGSPQALFLSLDATSSVHSS